MASGTRAKKKDIQIMNESAAILLIGLLLLIALDLLALRFGADSRRLDSRPDL
ncbi:MAG: hypothetical protein IT335_15430 [Thermomicrobiales bacterium]|jgi:hypothetical protein|nr:hypothetical protein [Thermomicrobiales bacterium]